MERKRIGKKGILAVLCMLALFMAAPVCVSAAVGSNAKGAKLPKYEKVVEIQVDNSDNKFSLRFYQAMKEAEAKASSKCQYKIIVPPGKYKLTHLITVTSNIWIYAKGATITADKKTTRILTTKSGSGKFYENIKIEGGVWDAAANQTAPKKSEVSDMMLRFSHVENMILTDMTIKCKRNNHIIEVSDMNGFTVRNCKISGNKWWQQVQPKEALQLDVATKAAMVNCTPYNGKGCHNVLIENNTFTNVSRGLGSHSYAEGAEKNPYTNITIQNNTFKNAQGEGIYVLYWKNCSILNNKITNAYRAGICLERSTQNKVANNTVKKITAYTGERKSAYGAYRAGVLLRDASSNNITGNTASGCNKAVLQTLVCKKNVIKKNKKK